MLQNDENLAKCVYIAIQLIILVIDVLFLFRKNKKSSPLLIRKLFVITVSIVIKM